MDETVTVELAVWPADIAGRVSEDGVRVIVKSAFDRTVRAKVWEWVRLPLVPVMVIE
jgi:hypothetical protein